MAKNDTPAGKAGAAGSKQGKNDAPASTAGLEVSSNQEGFRRAGFAFGKEPRVIAVADLTDEQISQLVNEPALTVREVDLSEQQ